MGEKSAFHRQSTTYRQRSDRSRLFDDTTDLDDTESIHDSNKTSHLWDLTRLNSLPPNGVVWVMCVGLCMALCSFLLVFLPPPFKDSLNGQNSYLKLVWVVASDCFAIQNLGHSAFLIMFATSWWRNNNILGLCMCQLSCLFLAFSSIGYCFLAMWHFQQATAAHFAIPLLFSVVLLISLVQCTRMAYRVNLAILRPKLYFKIDAESILRGLLFLNCVYTCLEPVLVSITRVVLMENHLFLHESLAFPTLTLRGFMETYTLGFHQAFVTATAFAQVLVEDEQKDIGAILLAFYGQISIVMAFGVGGINIPSDRIFSNMLGFKVFQHFCLSLLLARLAIRIRKSRQVKLEDESKEEFFEKKHNAFGREFDGVTLWSAVFTATSVYQRTIAKFALLAVGIHGIFWQLQSVLTFYLSSNSPQILDRINGFRTGLNFSLHGSGITIYLCVLALRSPVSFPMFRLAGVLGALGGTGISLLQLQILGKEESRIHMLTYYFFVFRACAGVLLGVIFSQLEYPEYHALSNENDDNENENENEILKYEDSTTPKIAQCNTNMFCSGKRRGLAFLSVFTFTVVVYAIVVTDELGNAGARSGFWLENEENQTKTSSKVDLWHAHRLVEFPPGYGLVYHFAFLMPGFVSHYYVQGFMPSKWISVAFTMGTVLIFATQSALCFSEIVNIGTSAETTKIAWASFAPSLAGIFLLVDLFMFVPLGHQRNDFNSADFWQ